MFNINDIETYSKWELVRYGIEFREKVKEFTNNIKIINAALMELHGLDWKERYWDYNVFEKQNTSYTIKKDYDYSEMMKNRPDLFEPKKAAMYKEFPELINRKISTTIEMSKDKSFTI